MKKVILTALLAVTINGKGCAFLKPRRDSHGSTALEITYVQTWNRDDVPQTSVGQSRWSTPVWEGQCLPSLRLGVLSRRQGLYHYTRKSAFLLLFFLSSVGTIQRMLLKLGRLPAQVVLLTGLIYRWRLTRSYCQCWRHTKPSLLRSACWN